MNTDERGCMALLGLQAGPLHVRQLMRLTSVLLAVQNACEIPVDADFCYVMYPTVPGQTCSPNSFGYVENPLPVAEPARFAS